MVAVAARGPAFEALRDPFAVGVGKGGENAFRRMRLAAQPLPVAARLRRAQGRELRRQAGKVCRGDLGKQRGVAAELRDRLRPPRRGEHLGDGVEQRLGADRFRHMAVHAGGAAARHLVGADARRQCQHRQAPAPCGDFLLAQARGGGDAVEDRHVYVHQQQIEGLGGQPRQRRFAVADDTDAMTAPFEHDGGNALVHQVVLGEQDAQRPARNV